jgi:hypothetical protein
MTTAVQPASSGGGGGGAVDRPSSSGLADVVDTILDKGLVIDAYVRVSLVGIELLTVDARVVVASVDTYLRFAEAVNRVDLTETGGKGLPEVLADTKEGGAHGAVKGATTGAIEAAGDAVKGLFDGDRDRPQRSSEGRRREAG